MNISLVDVYSSLPLLLLSIVAYSAATTGVVRRWPQLRLPVWWLVSAAAWTGLYLWRIRSMAAAQEVDRHALLWHTLIAGILVMGCAGACLRIHSFRLASAGGSIIRQVLSGTVGFLVTAIALLAGILVAVMVHPFF